jgi:hypothetical protein
MAIKLREFQTSPLEVGHLLRFQLLYPGIIFPGTECISGWGGPRTGHGMVAKKKYIYLPGTELQ